MCLDFEALGVEPKGGSSNETTRLMPSPAMLENDAGASAAIVGQAMIARKPSPMVPTLYIVAVAMLTGPPLML
jgi:hypothetical protein